MSKTPPQMELFTRSFCTQSPLQASQVEVPGQASNRVAMVTTLLIAIVLLFAAQTGAKWWGGLPVPTVPPSLPLPFLPGLCSSRDSPSPHSSMTSMDPLASLAPMAPMTPLAPMAPMAPMTLLASMAPPWPP